MMADNNTYRRIKSDLLDIQTPWNSEPIPDHTWLVRHMQTIPGDWLDLILTETTRFCIDGADGATGSLGADSSASETTRYTDIEKPDANERNFVEKPQRIYWKYHIMAVLGLQIILAVFATSGSVSDMTMLPAMMVEIKHRGFDFAGCVFDCDKGYDSDYNCRVILEMGMTSNIKQRKNAVSRRKPHRKKAAGLFDGEEHKERSLIENVLGQRRPEGTSCTAGSSKMTTGSGLPREGSYPRTSGSSTGLSAPDD